MPRHMPCCRSHESRLSNSPRYLDMAGLAYSAIGLHERALPLHRKANELQPGIPVFQANLAACSVYLGNMRRRGSSTGRCSSGCRRISAITISWRAWNRRQGRVPCRADEVGTSLPPACRRERNIFLYYAIGKELEDLGDGTRPFTTTSWPVTR